MNESTMRPDGWGLPAEAVQIIATRGGKVHLRLTSPDGSAALGACGESMGEWWTGVPSEVTCRRCRAFAGHLSPFNGAATGCEIAAGQIWQRKSDGNRIRITSYNASWDSVRYAWVDKPSRHSRVFGDYLRRNYDPCPPRR